MNFNQFVVRNTLRNKHLYLAYFLSTLFTVMVFFTFATFAFHPKLNDGTLQSQAQIGMMAAAVIIFIFSFFFVWSSMDIFIQSRKKEFGTLMIQGMSPKQLKKMIFLENLVIGFFATLTGMVVGLGFSQLVLWLSKTVMNIAFGFYFPLQALALTFVAFMILFLVISVFIQFKLPKLNVQELLKADELGKGDIKASPFKSLLGVALIIAGYVMALMAPGPLVIVVFIPVVFLVILGTKFFFNQFSVFAVNGLRKRQSLFWKKTNMVVFSDLAFRMKDNARSFFLVAVISTVAFSAIGSLYSFRQLLVGVTESFAYEFVVYNSDPTAVSQVADELQQAGFKSDPIPVTSYFGEGYQVLKLTDYNTVAAKIGAPQLSLQEGQLIQLSADDPTSDAPALEEATIGNQTYPISDHVSQHFFLTSTATVVVPDDLDLTGYQTDQRTYFLHTGANKAQQIQLGKKFATNENISSNEFIADMTIQAYAPVLFVGIFIGITFFVSAGSFLYFRLYSDMGTDIEKFKMIYKLGLSKKELKKMVNQQIGILFFTPIVISLLHGAIALTTMFHMFNIGMQIYGWQVLGLFLLIQVIYYLIARFFYFKKVYQEITA